MPKDYEYAYTALLATWYRVGAEHKHKKSMHILLSAVLAAAQQNLSPEELEEAEKLARKLIQPLQYGYPEEEKAQTKNK